MRQLLRPRRLLAALGMFGLLGAWYLWLGPTNIGGPTAYIEVIGHSMDGTYATGDLIITRQQGSYEAGDIVAFKVGRTQVIHRIIGGNGQSGYTLQGDNNPDPDPWHPTDAEVVGRSWVRIAGKAWILDLPRRPMFAGAVSGLVALVYVLADDRRSRRRASSAVPEQRRSGQDAAAASGATS